MSEIVIGETERYGYWWSDDERVTIGHASVDTYNDEVEGYAHDDQYLEMRQNANIQHMPTSQ